MNPQLQDEVHHLSKKGHSAEKGGFNFLAGLKKKVAKLQSEIENYESHEKLIDRNLREIKAGGGRLFNSIKCSASHSCNSICMVQG